MSISYCNTIVIDNGHLNSIVGLSSDDKPKVFPTVISKPNAECADVHVGHEAYNKRSSLTLKHPVSTFWVHDWNDMEKIWAYTFNNILGTSPKENPVLLTQISPVYAKEKEYAAQIMFEKFDTIAFYMAPRPVLTLLVHGLTTGCVIHGGTEGIMPIPVYEGHMLTSALMRVIPFGGVDITNYLMKLLNASGCSFDDKNIETVNNIKEKLCYTALDVEKEMHQVCAKRMRFMMPNEQVIHLGHELYQCAEPLFDPLLINYETSSLQEYIFNSIMRCDACIRDQLFSNIVMEGGPALMPGITQRVQKELIQVINTAKKIGGKYSPERICVSGPTNAHMTWSGGCILAKSNGFENKLISLEEYNEIGPNIVKVKCF